MAITRVAGVMANGQNGGTSASIDTTGATLLVAVYSRHSAAAVTISDSNGNTWSPLTLSNSNNPYCQIVYAANPTVGSGHTFTVNGTNVFSRGVFTAWAGVTTTSPFDVQSTGLTTTPGSVTPSEDNELVVIGVSADQAGPAAASGYTFDDGAGVIGGVAYGAWSLYQIQTTATTTNPTLTGVDTSSGASAIATFKEDAGAPDLEIPLLQPPHQANVYRM